MGRVFSSSVKPGDTEIEGLAEKLQTSESSDDDCLREINEISQNSSCQVEDYVWGKDKYTFSEEGKEEDELYGHTILHLALCYKKFKTALAIAEKYPGLITKDVQEEDQEERYKCLTPLHIAVSMGTCEVVEQLLGKCNKESLNHIMASHGNLSKKSNCLLKKMCSKSESSDESKRRIVESMKGTVFMGQLPFTVAVLSDISNFHPSSEDDHEMIQLLLKKTDCKLADTNYLGDTVLHSIMKYVTCFPAIEDRAVLVMEWLINKHISTRDNVKKHKTTSQKKSLNKILSMRNNDGKTAFQLAAERGHVKLYSYFLELYCLREPHDEVYQIGRYDITEIVKHSGSEKNTLKGHAIEEIVCCQPLTVAIRMIFEDVFDKIVSHKWKKYKCRLFHLFLIHIIVVGSLYPYALTRARAIEGWNWLPPMFLQVCCIIYIVVAVIYCLQELVRVAIAKQTMAWGAYHHNVVYRILTWVFSASLFVDSVLWLTSANVDAFLFVAILSGTWNLMFFLRVIPYFGVYIVLINEALMKAVFPFVVLSSLQLCAFSMSLHCLFLHPDDEQEPIGEFETVGKSMLSMGKLMIGLTEFDFLLKAKEDYLTVILFFLLILVGLLLMINALIGVMTNKFTDTQHDRLKVENLQKMSVIIYLEGWLVGCFFKCVQKMGKEKDGQYIFSYRKVPSRQADNPSGIEHRLRKEFKKTADTMSDVEKRMFCIEQKLESVLQKMGSLCKPALQDDITELGDSLAPLITQLEKQEAYVSEMLEVMRSQDDREKTLHIYHYQQQ